MEKERLNKVRAYLQEIITKDMSAEQLKKHQEMIEEIDELDKEDDARNNEISEYKDQIISLIKSQGSSNPPEEEKKPRTLEEIANDIRR